MKIAIASGKGGTGKTTIATNLALSLNGTNSVQYMDCDVEEPNGHLFLHPEMEDRISVGIPVPRVELSKCTYCGKCAQSCEFNAIVVIKEKVLIFLELCHGCGGCSYVCPEDAIGEAEREIGVIEKGHAKGIEFSHGLLTITAAFAALAQNQVMADGDVDAADLHLILNPHIQKQEDFFGGRAPSLDRNKCDQCGICMDVCRFDAIHDLISCEGCGLCMHACPYVAIAMEEKFSGQWFLSDTRFGPMVHAKLEIAEENSGKLVTQI